MHGASAVNGQDFLLQPYPMAPFDRAIALRWVGLKVSLYFEFVLWSFTPG